MALAGRLSSASRQGERPIFQNGGPPKVCGRSKPFAILEGQVTGVNRGPNHPESPGTFTEWQNALFMIRPLPCKNLVLTKAGKPDDSILTQVAMCIKRFASDPENGSANDPAYDFYASKPPIRPASVFETIPVHIDEDMTRFFQKNHVDVNGLLKYNHRLASTDSRWRENADQPDLITQLSFGDRAAPDSSAMDRKPIFRARYRRPR